MARVEEQIRLLDLAGDLVPSSEWFDCSRKKNRAVVFKEYLDYLREGTELPTR